MKTEAKPTTFYVFHTALNSVHQFSSHELFTLIRAAARELERRVFKTEGWEGRSTDLNKLSAPDESGKRTEKHPTLDELNNQ